VKATKFRQQVVLLVVAIHLAIVPLVVWLTNQLQGFQNALTLSNQATWVPIHNAHACLLGLYFGLGHSTLRRRAFLFAVGCTVLCISRVLAQAMLATFPAPMWLAFVRNMLLGSLIMLVPTFFIAGVMLLLRPLLGELRHAAATKSNVQFALKELFLLATLVCLAATWFAYVARLPLSGDSEKRNIDFVPVVPHSLWAMRLAFGTIASTWLMFSQRAWWIGLAALSTLLAYEWIGLVAMPDLLAHEQASSMPHWEFSQSAYGWAVVLVTMLIFRLLGYRLRRERLCTQNLGAPAVQVA